MKNNPDLTITPPLKLPIGQVEASDYRSLGVTIRDSDLGVRVDSFLARELPFYSRHKWRRQLHAGKVLVNERQVRASYRVRCADTFMLYHPQKAEPTVDEGILPLWKHGEIMAFYKPGDLPMHENGPYRTRTFSHILARDYGSNWSAIHRLDRETSGIVLCSSSPKLRHKLSEALTKGDIQKEYWAICAGKAKAPSFREQGSIGDLKGSSIRIKKWVVADGQPAETWFDVLEQKNAHCLLLARPKTGRTNQIRIHAAINHLPIVGDKLYHANENVFEEYFKHRGNTPWIIQQTGFHRLCLHAARLTFYHPESQELCDIQCPPPQELLDFWDRLN